MSLVQKQTLLDMALSDSKWTGEGKMDLNVQMTMLEDGTLDDCLVPTV